MPARSEVWAIAVEVEEGNNGCGVILRRVGRYLSAWRCWSVGRVMNLHFLPQENRTLISFFSALYVDRGSLMEM